MADKGNRGGKYKVEPNKGRYGTDIAGQKHKLKEREAGTKRKFKGSGQHNFIFYSPEGGTQTIVAKTYEEAWRIAKRRGLRTRRRRK